MNLITILNYQKQLQKYNQERNKKKLKNQKQQIKCNNQIDINLQNIDLYKYQISQKIEEHKLLEIPPNNLQSQQIFYVSTSTQTDYIEDNEDEIPEIEIRKLKHSYEKLLKLEELKKKYKDCIEINQIDAIEQIKQSEFEIKRLMHELDQLPQIDYRQDLKQQQQELKTLKNQYSALQKEHEELQQRNTMLLQNLKEKLHQKNH
ncbi:unnamed protein product [Paramecium pentaurelia]|uniref:Uncharacterized protein n=1 Tax=Paramecium pentaurelia TaxID=43138 RepID=A0A8S1TCS1_9CILI|nr:unnamed protein product [Paramecium pentaurelia]